MNKADDFTEIIDKIINNKQNTIFEIFNQLQSEELKIYEIIIDSKDYLTTENSLSFYNKNLKEENNSLRKKKSKKKKEFDSNKESLNESFFELNQILNHNSNTLFSQEPSYIKTVSNKDYYSKIFQEDNNNNKLEKKMSSNLEPDYIIILPTDLDIEMEDDVKITRCLFLFLLQNKK